MTATAAALAQSAHRRRAWVNRLKQAAPLVTARRSLLSDAYHPNAPWPAMRGRTGNTGFVAGLLAEPTDAPVRIWTTGNGVFSTPIIGPYETIFVGSADKNFYAFDARDGSTLWQVRTGECIDSAACIDNDNKVYVPSCDGSVYALDARTGALAWRFNALNERVGYTPSTIYWWEGNLGIGPGGLLYGGNDNFYLYALHREDGRVAWAHPTGLNIWSAPAFDAQGRLYGASFDMHAFCLDAQSGKQRWRACVGNLVAASPALTAHDTVVLGTLGGDVVALDRGTGKERWRQSLGGHIYASVAVAPDDKLFVGSADGVMVCLDTQTGARLWTYDTGDAIRGSASLGPDPTHEASYLVYFGSGNGVVYALEPSGRRRWSFDTAGGEQHTEYGNINASIALGKQGLATGSAKGEVIWIPYDAYLRKPGFVRAPTDGFAEDGAFLHVLSSGGTVSRMAHPDIVTVRGAQTLTLRTSVRERGQTILARLVPSSVVVSITPPLPHDVVHPDAEHVSIVPRALLASGQVYTADIRCMMATGTGEQVQNRRTLRFVAAEVAAPSAAQLLDQRMRLSHIAVYEPAMVPSFDQIGLASLHLDLRIVHHNPNNHRVVAWGVLPFGADEDGSAVGVPQGRQLLFAFGGVCDHGHFALEAARPWFEITATPVPLDRLRITGTLPPLQGVQDGGSLVAEVRVPSVWQLCKNLMTGRAKILTKTLRSARAGSAETHAALPGGWRRGLTLMRRMGATVWRLMRGNVHKAWGLLGADGQFSGVGTFRLATLSSLPAAAKPLEVVHVRPDRQRHEVVATLRGPVDAATALGMLAIATDDDAPWPLDYNVAVRRQSDKQGHTTLRLRMPKAVFQKSAPPTDVIILQNCEVLHRCRIA